MTFEYWIVRQIQVICQPKAWKKKETSCGTPDFSTRKEKTYKRVREYFIGGQGEMNGLSGTEGYKWEISHLQQKKLKKKWKSFIDIKKKHFC